MKKIWYALMLLCCLEGFSQSKIEEGALLSLAYGYGDNYQSAGLNTSIEYTWPLFKKPGVLLDTTCVKAGIHNTYAFVMDSFGTYLEITPVSLITFNFYTGWDQYFWTDNFQGGIRSLTPAASDLWDLTDLSSNRISGDLDWTRQDFLSKQTIPKDGGGLNIQISSSMQGAYRFLAFQYTFRYKYYDYKSAESTWFYSYTDNMIAQTTDSFLYHELRLINTFKGFPLEKQAVTGIHLFYKKPLSHSLYSQRITFFAFAKPSMFKRGNSQPFFGGEIGTYIEDPIKSIRSSISWRIFLGLELDFKTLPSARKNVQTFPFRHRPSLPEASYSEE